MATKNPFGLNQAIWNATNASKQVQPFFGINPNTSNFLQPIANPYQSSPQVQGTQTQAPAKTSSGSNNNSGGGGGTSYQDQWRALGRSGDVPVGWHGESTQNNQNNELNNQINAIYDPIMSSLNATESYYRNTELPNALSGLDRTKGELLSTLSTEEQKGKDVFAGQQQQLGENQRSAFDQAVRAYNSLQQQQQARFGAGSSAGQAVGEIAAQEFYRNQGNVQKTYAQALGQLQNNQSDFIRNISDKRLQINNSIEEEKNKLNADFQQKLLQINNQRNAADSQKSAMKLDLLQQTLAQSRQLESLKTQALIQLDTYKAQFDYSLKQQLGALNQNYSTFNVNPYSQPTGVLGAQQPSNSYQNSIQYQIATPEEKRRLDELQGITTPRI